MRAANELSCSPMASNLRDALTSLDARTAPPQSALQDLPGERLLLDVTRLGLRSVFGGDLQGRATFVLHEDDSGYFETPDELSQIGMIRGEDISEHLSFQDVTADLHETLRERLDAESAALEALDLDVILEFPLAQAQGITFIGRHRVSIGASIDGDLWLLTLDEVPVPEELAALGLHMRVTSAEELWQTLQNALQNQDLINLSLPPQEAEAHPAIAASPPVGAAVLDEDTLAQQATPRVVTVHSAHMELPEHANDLDWDEDEAPTRAIPALSFAPGQNLVEQPPLLDALPDVAEPFEEDDRPQDELDTSSHAVGGAGATSFNESAPPQPPPAMEEFDLDADEGAEHVPTSQSYSAELSMPDVGELEFPASAVDMTPEPEAVTPVANAVNKPLDGALADGMGHPSAEEVPGTASPSTTVPIQEKPAERSAPSMPLAAVVGDGIASGRTGAIELNADAFAALGREDLDMAESLEREAEILEARVIELRANAKRLRERYGNLATLFGLRSADANAAAPELSISEWASGELPSDLSELEQEPPASTTSSSKAEVESVSSLAVAERVEEASDTFAAADPGAQLQSPYPEMMAPNDEQATQMVEMRASAFGSLRKQTPEAISNMESASAASGTQAPKDGVETTQAIVRPDLGGSLSYERAVDDALASLGGRSAPNEAGAAQAENAHSTRQQDAELEAALSQDFDSESMTGIAPVSEPEAEAEPFPDSIPEAAAEGMDAEPEAVLAAAVRPSRVALVVDDARARSRLQKHLQDALGEMDEAATLVEAHAQLDLSQVGCLVAVRPKADDATFGALSALASNEHSLFVLILSSDARFDGAAGVSLRLELARRASEVADQVVQGLEQLGVVTNHA